VDYSSAEIDLFDGVFRRPDARADPPGATYSRRRRIPSPLAVRTDQVAGCEMPLMTSRSTVSVLHEESLGNGLHPGTDQGQSLATDISAKIANGESDAELMQPLIWLDYRRLAHRRPKKIAEISSA
jgi:hypothetical protein